MAEQFFITGAARGVGLAMTGQLLDRGCRVGAFVRKESDGLRDLQSRSGGRLSIHLGDVTDEASIQKAFADVAERLGHLDVIINNAVIYLDGSRPSIEDADLAICARTFEVNAVGPMRVVKHGLPLLRKGSRKAATPSNPKPSSPQLKGASWSSTRWGCRSNGSATRRSSSE